MTGENLVQEKKLETLSDAAEANISLMADIYNDRAASPAERMKGFTQGVGNMARLNGIELSRIKLAKAAGIQPPAKNLHGLVFMPDEAAE